MKKIILAATLVGLSTTFALAQANPNAPQPGATGAGVNQPGTTSTGTAVDRPTTTTGTGGMQSGSSKEGMSKSMSKDHMKKEPK